jgi:hypothetical protein
MLRFGYLVMVGVSVACSLFACGDKLNPKGNAPTASGGTTGTGGTTETGDIDGSVSEAGVPIGGASGTGGTTTAAVVSYKNTIAPIMTAKCTACHTGSSGFKDVALDTYAGVAANADLSLATMQPGATDPMPPGGSVSAADLKSFQDWIKAGKPNN